MILKIIGMVLIFTSATLAGRYYSQMGFRRITELGEMKKAITILKSEIQYAITPLPEAFFNISQRVDKPVSKILLEISESLTTKSGDSVYDIWKKCFLKYKDKTYFSAEDIEAFSSFSKTLGYLDKNMQINTIQITIDYITSKIENIKETDSKKSVMYQSIGVLSGLLVIIILI